VADTSRADFAHGAPPDAEGEGGKMKPAGGETHRGLPRLGSWTSLCMGAMSVAGNAVNAIVPKLVPEEAPQRWSAVRGSGRGEPRSGGCIVEQVRF
jgi:hypothetical protein